MSVSRKLVAVVVVFLMVFAVSAFAGSVKDLSKHLWTWAVMEELMDEAAHGGMPPIGPVAPGLPGKGWKPGLRTAPAGAGAG